MSIPIEAIPESLRSDKTVTTFISRSTELEEINPIISYYCKIYVLEYILTNKLHTINKDNEAFTINLLDVTEQTKKANEDETLTKVLNDKQLSINMVFSFSFRIFNSSLTVLSKYDGSNESKNSILSKLKASINFLSLLSVFFDNEDNESLIDYEKLTGGNCKNSSDFNKFIKDKIKICKFQLSQLLKGNIPILKDVINDEELEDEFDRELNELSKANKGGDELNDEDDVEMEQDGEESNDIELPSAPNYIESYSSNQSPTMDEEKDEFKLPGAPHFTPESDASDNDSSEDDGNLKLPGAPKFLPDDDLSQINKKSSIQVYPNDNSGKSSSNDKEAKPKETKPVERARTTTKHNTVNVTKENIGLIIDKSEHITIIQKHAKFAISALNYEDLDTAETELVKGLELLRSLKN